VLPPWFQETTLLCGPNKEICGRFLHTKLNPRTVIHCSSHQLLTKICLVWFHASGSNAIWEATLNRMKSVAAQNITKPWKRESEHHWRNALKERSWKCTWRACKAQNASQASLQHWEAISSRGLAKAETSAGTARRTSDPKEGFWHLAETLWKQCFYLGFLGRWKSSLLDFSLVDFLATPIFFEAKWEKLKMLL
jgi:hypothetical protein